MLPNLPAVPEGLAQQYLDADLTLRGEQGERRVEGLTCSKAPQSAASHCTRTCIAISFICETVDPPVGQSTALERSHESRSMVENWELQVAPWKRAVDTPYP